VNFLCPFEGGGPVVTLKENRMNLFDEVMLRESQGCSLLEAVDIVYRLMIDSL